MHYVNNMKKPTVKYSKPLKNARHEAYCGEYVLDFNRIAAYKRVYGEKFKEKTNVCSMARKVLALPEVIGRVEFLRKESVKKHKLNKKYVLEKWMRIVEDENTRAIPKLKALQCIAEFLGMLNQKIDVNHKGNINHRVGVGISWVASVESAGSK
jgi:hypothetical protein